MKKILFGGLALVMLHSGISFAQSNQNSYSDDIYYHASQAEKDANREAQVNAQNQQNDSAAYYNSFGTGYYNNSSNNQAAYSQDAYDSNGYIDYNDDYTTRIRRFYYPMSGVGYWGSVYDPFWNSPYYGWGNSWYNPGMYFSFGWNPYWAGNWGFGWNNWYGYGWNSYPYYNPYYGYGWGGYGMGYWNGFYDGLNNGWNYGNNSNSRGNYNYGPRGSRNSGVVRGVGNYGVDSRTSPINRTTNTVSPQRSSMQQVIAPNSRVIGVSNNDNNMESQSRIRLGNIRIYNNNDMPSQSNSQTTEINRGNNTSASQISRQRRVSREFDNSNDNRSYQRSDYSSPSRSYSPPARTQSPAPTRSYTPSSSRSYRPPARSSSSSRSVRR